MAVLAELHQKVVSIVLQYLTEDSSLPFLEYTNQFKGKDAESIPDARIQVLFSYGQPRYVDIDRIQKATKTSELNSD